MKYETAAKAFEAVKALALDPNNALKFIWIANAAIKHYEEAVQKSRLNILIQREFGNDAQQIRADNKYTDNMKCLEIVNTLREWLTLSNIEQSIP